MAYYLLIKSLTERGKYIRMYVFCTLLLTMLGSERLITQAVAKIWRVLHTIGINVRDSEITKAYASGVSIAI